MVGWLLLLYGLAEFWLVVVPVPNSAAVSAVSGTTEVMRRSLLAGQRASRSCKTKTDVKIGIQKKTFINVQRRGNL